MEPDLQNHNCFCDRPAVPPARVYSAERRLAAACSFEVADDARGLLQRRSTSGRRKRGGSSAGTLRRAGAPGLGMMSAVAPPPRLDLFEASTEQQQQQQEQQQSPEFKDAPFVERPPRLSQPKDGLAGVDVAKTLSKEQISRREKMRNDALVALRTRRKRGGGPGSRGGRVRNVEDSALNYYLSNISKVALLEAHEEIILGRQIQMGIRYEAVRDHMHKTHSTDPTNEQWAYAVGVDVETLMSELRRARKAKQAMLKANLRLVVSIAKRYRWLGLTFSDLIQEGTFGLVKATERFDPERGFKFSTYATWWIKQSVQQGLSGQGRAIRLPVHVHHLLSAVRKATKDLTDAYGIPPSDEQLSRELATSVDKIRFYRYKAQETLSMQSTAAVSKAGRAPKEESDAEAELVNTIEIDGETPEDMSMDDVMKDRVTQLLMTLNRKEQEVMRSRYGLDGATIRSTEEVAEEWGFTRERVRQIESRALHKLRQPYRNYRVRDYTVNGVHETDGIAEADPGSLAAAAAAIADAESASRNEDVVLERTKLGLPLLEDDLMMASEAPEALGVRAELQSRSTSAMKGMRDGGIHASVDEERRKLGRKPSLDSSVPGSYERVADRLAYRAMQQAQLSQGGSSGGVGGVSGAGVLGEQHGGQEDSGVDGNGNGGERRQQRPKGQRWRGVEKGSVDEQTLLKALEKFDLLDDDGDEEWGEQDGRRRQRRHRAGSSGAQDPDFPAADIGMELGEGEEEGDDDDGEDEDADFLGEFDGVELEEDLTGFPGDVMQSREGEKGKGKRKRKRQVGTPVRMSPSSSKTLARLRSEMESRPMSLGGRMSPSKASTVDLPSLQLA